MRKKTLCLLLIVLCIGTGFFARGFIVSSLFQACFHHYCSTILDAKLSYEHVRYEEGKWQLDHPSLVSSMEMEEGGHCVCAKQATIEFTPSWLERRLDVAISLIDLNIDIGQGALALKKLINAPPQDFRLFTIDTHVTVPKGSLALVDTDQKNALKAPVHFSVDMGCGKENKGQCSLWYGEDHDPAQKEKCLKVTVSDAPSDGALDEGALQVAVHANAMDCSELLAVLKHVWPGCEGFLATSGHVHGDAVFILEQKAQTKGEGQFVIEDLSLGHLIYEWQCHIPQLVMTLSAQNTLKATVSGFQGEIEIDGKGNHPGEVAHVDFKGVATDLLPILPPALRQGLEKFGQDELLVSVGLSRKGQEVGVAGSISLAGKEVKEQKAQPDVLTFGFSLEPFCLATEEKWFKEGWFKAKQLPLEKFLSPFLFPQDQIHLSGQCELEGSFNEKEIFVNYGVKDLVLENADFCIEIKQLFDPAVDTVLTKLADSPLVATYRFDVEAGRSISYLPVVNGTYFEKNSGLLFTDIQAIVVLEDDRVRLSQVESFSNGLFLGGTIDLNWSMPGDGVFEVDIVANEMQGKVSQVQDFLSHFNPSLLFLKVPLEGNVECHEEGGLFHFAFSPQGYELQSKVKGSLSDGVFLSSLGDISLQELGADFYYDHQGNSLEFSNIEGTLLVGSPNHVEEYALLGEGVRFTDYSRNESSFDLWIADKRREVMRVAGSTCSKDESGNLVDFVFDLSKCHFGNVHPSLFELTLKNFADVDTFQMALDFDMDLLLQDLQRFSRTGLFFLSRNLLQDINEIQAAQGHFKAQFDYEGQKGELTYRVEGVDVAVGAYAPGEFLLSGKKRQSTWTIDQLQWDRISLAADIVRSQDLWDIHFLAARVGSVFLLGMEGQYREDDAVLAATVNLLEIDFRQMDEWPVLKALLEESGLEGHLRANGDVSIAFDKDLTHGMQVQASLHGALRNAKWRGLYFQDIEHMAIGYTSDKGLSVRDIYTALKSAKDGSIQASLFLQSAHLMQAMYGKERQTEFLLDSLSFSIPTDHLAWVSENLQQAFPDLITADIEEMIRMCKAQGEVKGQLKFEHSPPHSAWRLTLDDDIYRFMQRDHDVSHLVLEYDPFEFRVSTKYRFGRHRFWLTARSASSVMNRGEIVLSEQVLDAYDDPASFPLTIDWSLDPALGLTLHKIEGSLCGLSCRLLLDPQYAPTADQLFLTGEVQADISRMQALFDQEIADVCAFWEVGKGYALKGQWAIAKGDKPLSESVTFQGELLGRNFECCGYQFYNLTAQIGYSGNALRAVDICVNDPSAGLHIRDVMFAKETDGAWSFLVPTLTLSDLRPSLLRVKGGQAPRSPKALVIRQCDLRDFKGIVGDRATYAGRGRLFFTNPPKKHVQHTIFALPAEIMTRLGLDLAVLNPVRGLIFYDIKDSKIGFTRFKDVYSKGRLSKFYLSHSGLPSYMDFDGNLNLHIRMKQYNLFFKLAELFTVTVQGNLKKPTYSLQKQPRLAPLAGT